MASQRIEIADCPPSTPQWSSLLLVPFERISAPGLRHDPSASEIKALLMFFFMRVARDTSLTDEILGTMYDTVYVCICISCIIHTLHVIFETFEFVPIYARLALLY